MTSIKDGSHIGMKIKLRRRQLGMSQEKLGEMIGVTYQQIQKYEKGVNKFSAERLHKIAQSLNVSTNFFFEDKYKLNNLPSQEQELIKYFRAITNEEYKLYFLSLLRQTSKDEKSRL